MEAKNLAKELGASSYPGRGIITGLSPDGKYAMIAYFIMGRSENSRNRVFVEDGDGIRTKAFDESKLEDPSLIIYAPVRVLGERTIVTNGDQTDTVYDGLSKGLTFEQSLRSREFEPDAPNYTPRISAAVTVKDGAYSYEMSILKSSPFDKTSCDRFTYSYEKPVKGIGHFLHTYMGDGNPLPSYDGEPTPVEVSSADIDAFTDEVWKALDEDNKVSLFTRFIDLAAGQTQSRIINKNK